jgi:hypothetical protein
MIMLTVSCLIFVAHAADSVPGDIELGEVTRSGELLWTLLHAEPQEDQGENPIDVGALNEMLLQLNCEEAEIDQTTHNLENEQTSAQQMLQTNQKRGPILKQHLIKANFFLLLALNAASLIYESVVDNPDTRVLSICEVAIPLLAMIPFGKLDSNLADESKKLIDKLQEITEKKTELSAKKEALQKERARLLQTLEVQAGSEG